MPRAGRPWDRRQWAGRLLATWLAGSAPLAAAQAVATPLRRGPFEAREQWLLTEGRLALPAESPDPLAPGAWRLRLDLDWGNDFAHRFPRYLVDGEHRALALGVRRGVSDALTLGVRLPLLWRGGGFLDRFADAIHTLGFPDNQRPLFPRDRLVVTAIDTAGRGIAWDDRSATGLGKLELEALVAPLRPRGPRRTAFTLAARVALPTGSGAFAVGGLEAGAQALFAVGLGERFDLYLGTGASLGGERRRAGFEYARVRGFGHLALEWRFARRWSALAQADGGGRLVTNVPEYPGLQSYLRLGLKWDVGPRSTLEGCFTENLKNQQATTDFGVYLALARRF